MRYQADQGLGGRLDSLFGLSQASQSKVPVLGKQKQIRPLICLALIFLLGALGPAMTYTGTAGTGDGTALRQLAFGLVFLVAIWSLNPVRYPSRIMSIPFPILLVLAWFWLSVTWAISPEIALRRVVLTTVIIWAIFSCVRNVNAGYAINAVRIITVIVLVSNYLSVLLFPEFAIHTSMRSPIYGDSLDGLWRGIMMHKNFAGAISALTIIVFCFDREKLGVYIPAIIIALSSYFLYMSGSKTPLGVCLVSVAAGFVFRYWPQKTRPYAFFVVMVIAIAGALLGFIYKNPLSGHFTDPKAFTGRPLIWRALYNYVQEHPLFGAGYGSFWNIGPQGPIFHYATGWVAKVEVGHNGYLDILAQTGVVGLILVVFAAVIYPIWLLLKSRGDSEQGALAAAIICFSVAYNATESSMFDRDSITQLFLMFAIALICAPLGNRAKEKIGISKEFQGLSKSGRENPQRI